MSLWLLESPEEMIEGEAIAYSVDWQGASDVSSADMAVYIDGTDITDEVLLSEDDYVYSGNVLTLKKITARSGDGDSNYVVVIQATVDGNTEKRKLLINVLDPTKEQ